MPYAKCPVCGTLTHLQVGDIAVWYQDYWPGYQIGALVPAKCPGCWFDLQIGHRVRVRTESKTHPERIHVGDIGIVIAIDVTPCGETQYTVEQDTTDQARWCAVFIRQELSYLIGQQRVRSP